MKRLCQIFDDSLYVSIFELIDSRMYVLVHKDNALVVDPCVDEKMIEYLHENGVNCLTVIPTHEHYDHISGINRLKEEFKSTVICNRLCSENMGNPKKNLSAMFSAMFINEPDKLELIKKLSLCEYSCTAEVMFDDSYTMTWCGHNIHIFLSPGHSQGSQCILLDEDWIFTGDSLLQNIPVITRLPGGNKKTYDTVTKPMLEKLCYGKMILPGHGEIFRCRILT